MSMGYRGLASRRAVLADRVQIASLALWRAVQRHDPDYVGRRGRGANVRTLARIYTHRDLSDYVQSGAEDAVLDASASERGTAHRDLDEWSELRYARQVELTNFIGLRDPLSLDGMEPDSITYPDTIFDTATTPMLGELIEQLLAKLDERERFIVRRYLDLDDEGAAKLAEIGTQLGLTAERVRQIKDHALAKLRHPANHASLAAWFYDDADAETILGARMSLIRLGMLPVSKGRATSNLEEDADWEYPEPTSETVRANQDEAIKRTLTEVILSAATQVFKETQLTRVREKHLTDLVRRIKYGFGASLRAHHVEDVWSTSVEEVLAHMVDNLGIEASYDQLGQFFSLLLSEVMTDEDTVTLDIPEVLQGKLGYIGSWIKAGKLIVNGPTGNSAATGVEGTAVVILNGDAGDYVANGAKGFARVEVVGRAGNFAGTAMAGNSSLKAGNVGDYCGHTLASNNVTIEVLGNAGENLGYNARYGHITVFGNVISVATAPEFGGVITLRRRD